MFHIVAVHFCDMLGGVRVEGRGVFSCDGALRVMVFQFEIFVGAGVYGSQC